MRQVIFSLILLMMLTPSLAANQSCSKPIIRSSKMSRYIISNGLPCSHGNFPNSGNPNSISQQEYAFKFPLSPTYLGRASANQHYLFGVALDGIPFDPGTAEWWNNDRQSGWNYDAMTGHVNLGLDQNHAHVQPNGAYHYHGMPSNLINHPQMTLVGFAADGFPIYARYGLNNPNDLSSGIKILAPSYHLKAGSRSSGPGGRYDGRFVQDFTYQKGYGDLDECNGLFGKTPEYPHGIYQYYITDSFPFVPRCFMGVPDSSFAKQMNGRRPPPPNHQHQPPRRQSRITFPSNPQLYHSHRLRKIVEARNHQKHVLKRHKKHVSARHHSLTFQG